MDVLAALALRSAEKAQALRLVRTMAFIELDLALAGFIPRFELDYAAAITRILAC
jgi:hypothetical protein